MKRRKPFTLKEGCCIAVLCYLVLAVAVYWIGGDQFFHRVKSTDSVVSTAGAVPITRGGSIEQVFTSQADLLNSVSVKTCTFARKNRGTMTIRVLNNTDRSVVMSASFDAATLPDNNFVQLKPEKPVANAKGKQFRILITTDSADAKTAPSVVYNDTVQSAGQLLFNGVPQKGTMCFSTQNIDILWFGPYYFEIAGIVGFLMIAYCVNLCRWQKKGEKSLGLNAISAFTRYRFLLKQLVSRDFKTKYKRSVLGVFWSFLNPLLTMTVQYVIFSTIFKQSVTNFPVYLLTGIVFFNFFSESCGMGLMSILGNSTLITKVYIPKYIFPISRVLSSAINLLISIIPLLLAAVVTRAPIRPALLLLPFSIVCAMLFCIGISFILSSAMVFFRDMQFLWNVISMLWMYATPIFYPENIIPKQFLTFYKMNPLYQFITFSRTVILQGVSPEPKAYFFCLLCAVVPFCLGALLFKKTQDKFILYI
jgi:ABC-2 type transport system permease protein